MGASVFLNVVTIGAATLMLCIACTILYNKYYDIVEELQEFSRRRRGETPQPRAAEKDVEAAVTDPADHSPTPKRQRRLRKAPTIETTSPDSSAPDDEEDDWRKEALKAAAKRQKEVNASRLYKNQQSHQLQLNRALSDQQLDVDSLGDDSCSCYLDGSYGEQSANLPPQPTKDTTTFSPLARSNITLTTTQLQAIGNQMDDVSCMDYSVDSSMMMDHKESFSSFARPNLTTMDTTADHDHQEERSSKLFHSPLDKSGFCMTGNHLDDIESVETSVVPESEATSNEESDQFSMVRPSLLNFTSRNSSDATSAYCNKIVQVTNTEAVSPLRTKTKVTITADNSDFIMKDDEISSYSAEEIDGPLKKKSTTPHTVSTAGLWSPSSDPESPLEEVDVIDDDNNNKNPNESFTSDRSSEDNLATLETIQREAKNECFAPFYASHSVHVCKSATCSACRNPQNEPIFLNATKTSTGDQYGLRRNLPKRWWDTKQAEHVGKLKQDVASVFLTPQQASNEVDQSVEDHPFDEA